MTDYTKCLCTIGKRMGVRNDVEFYQALFLCQRAGINLGFEFVIHSLGGVYSRSIRQIIEDEGNILWTVDFDCLNEKTSNIVKSLGTMKDYSVREIQVLFLKDKGVKREELFDTFLKDILILSEVELLDYYDEGVEYE